MVNAIVKGLFYVISMIASAIMSPIVSIITSLFPDLQTAITNVTQYFNTIVTFIPLCLELSMIPRTAIVFLFDYYLIKYAIYLGVASVKAIITIYNKLKM